MVKEYWSWQSVYTNFSSIWLSVANINSGLVGIPQLYSSTIFLRYLKISLILMKSKKSNDLHIIVHAY